MIAFQASKAVFGMVCFTVECHQLQHQHLYFFLKGLACKIIDLAAVNVDAFVSSCMDFVTLDQSIKMVVGDTFLKYCILNLTVGVLTAM